MAEQTTQQAAAAVMTNRPNRKQETGKEKAGRPAHPLDCVNHDNRTCTVPNKTKQEKKDKLLFAPTEIYQQLSGVFHSLILCASVFSVCLSSPHTVCQTPPSSQTSNPALHGENKGGKDAFSCDVTPATTSENPGQKKTKNKKTKA